MQVSFFSPLIIKHHLKSAFCFYLCCLITIFIGLMFWNTKMWQTCKKIKINQENTFSRHCSVMCTSSTFCRQPHITSRWLHPVHLTKPDLYHLDWPSAALWEMLRLDDAPEETPTAPLSPPQNPESPTASKEKDGNPAVNSSLERKSISGATNWRSCKSSQKSGRKIYIFQHFKPFGFWCATFSHLYFLPSSGFRVRQSSH